VSPRACWGALQRALEVPERGIQIRRARIRFEIEALEIGLVGFSIHRSLARQTTLLAGQKRQSQRSGDTTGHIALQRENARQLAFERVGPALRAIAHVDERRADANARALAPRAAFEHRGGECPAADLIESRAAILVSHRRGPRDHAESLRVETTQL